MVISISVFSTISSALPQNSMLVSTSWSIVVLPNSLLAGFELITQDAGVRFVAFAKYSLPVFSSLVKPYLNALRAV